MKKFLWAIAGLSVPLAALLLSLCLRSETVPLPQSPSQTESAPLSVAETHTPAAEPQTVEDPIVGFCGNTFTTIHLEGRVYSIMGGDSVELTALLINAAYDPAALCDCLPAVTVITEMGGPYGLDPEGAYIRCEKGQASLTVEQVELVRGILSRLDEKDRVE